MKGTKTSKSTNTKSLTKSIASKPARGAAPKKLSKGGLGKGLDNLLGDDIDILVDLQKKPTVGTQTLPVTALQAGKYQPRTHMDETALMELSESIKEQGLMQPILVRPVGKNKYEIIAGERRFRAAKLAGLEEVPVLIKEVSDQNAAVMALIENMQREDLNPLEEAKGIQRLLNEFKFSHEQAAQAIGRSRSATSNLLRLLNLASPVQTMLNAGDIDMGHARALLALDSAQQIIAANQVHAKQLSVRETEKLVNKLLAGEGAKSGAKTSHKPVNRDIERLQENLSDYLATKVSFKLGRKGSGQLVIDFNDSEHINALLEKMGLSVVFE
ncbi:ParB/RepB/Spo0J family partition protein [Pelistega europaea]|uniref:ParB/RepB/Spo0J family partition protein n=1 Tax=Pelistega europaea TaxID=106147 RepID=A0A7Y4P735_9BURK|nr:ParB/RepB/Spo0J family partition protein [Pelistega europaea]NOL50534.1 ParB/RepB/Spo0J family partition protein [Pelistega europaea]